MKKALITGVTGQDGSYLSEFLLSKGYEVHGIIRRASTFNTHRIEHLYVDPHDPSAKLLLHYGDLTDPGLLTELMYSITPDEVYHLGSQSHVRVSFEMPELTGNVTGLGTTRILEAIHRSGIKTRFYQASSSEMFGSAKPLQSEKTPFEPRSPYAVAKLYAYWMVVNYRKGYNMFATNGILFNHESPRRGENFLTRKITRALAHMLNGKQKKIYLGNLGAHRDWGFAPEYIETMWKMLQQDYPDDYVVGTGQSHSVKEFLMAALDYVGIGVEWKGTGAEEKAIVVDFDRRWNGRLRSGDTIVEIDPDYFRPTEVDFLQADITKAKKELGWEPRVSFEGLVHTMIDFDMSAIGLPPLGKSKLALEGKGFDWTNHEFAFHQNIRDGGR